METIQLKVTGMMCEACVGHVQKALRAVPGVQEVTVDLKAAGATVRHEKSDVAAMIAAIEEEGYTAQSA